MSKRRSAKADPPLGPRAASMERTREALIDAALACFAESGIYEPSLDAICARAGCTRGAFYVHFRDREELVVAAMERRRTSLLAGFLDPGGGGASILDLLQAFAQAVESGAFPVPGAVRTGELVSACRRSPAIRAAQLALVRRTLKLLEARARADQTGHRLRADVPASSVALLLLVAEAGGELLMDLGFPLDARQVVDLLRRLLSDAPLTPNRRGRDARPSSR